MIPKRAGYPVVEPRWRMALPPSLDLLYSVRLYLGYLVGQRRAWSIHVLEGDLSNGGVRDAEVIRTISAKNRLGAKSRIHEVGQLLEDRGLVALPSPD